MMKYFTIYGERCSGTNFLENAISENFELDTTWKYGWKHFFGNYQFNNDTHENETLFIGIIRESVSWIDSFYKELHHIPNHNRQNIDSFLNNEFYSILDHNLEENMDDRNILTKERYKNIFELRKIKNDFLIYSMPNLAKNYVLIKYEDLRDNYQNVLEYIKVKFDLNKYSETDKYTKINKFKGIEKCNNYKKKEIILSNEIIQKVKNSVEYEQEKLLGYL